MTDGWFLVLLAHAAGTWAMVGLIWFVQVVHYPLFAAVGEDRFIAYEARHTRLTAWVVGAPMATEGFAALALLTQVDHIGLGATGLGLALLAAIHASTVLLQVPCHRRLSSGFNDDVARRLVATNWVRTVGWSCRGFLVLWMVSAVR